MASQQSPHAALAAAESRVRTLLPALEEGVAAGLLPHVTEHGRWEWVPFGQTGRWDGDRWSHGYWTGGFVAGWLWQLSQVSADPPSLRESAGRIARALAVRADDTVTHDVGFLFWPSAVLGAIATGTPDLAALAHRAATTLMSRVHSSGLIQAWGSLTDPRARGSSTIDTMMNLPLLWWAAQNGNPAAADVAATHARITADIYIRADGTTFHTARIDDAGRPVARGTYQGYSDASCWSRGQAWAVHGFVDAYRATGDAAFRSMAEVVIEAFLKRLPADGIAPWDFDDPEWMAAPRDASATAIVAVALLKFARALGESPAAVRWVAEGVRLVDLLLVHAANSGDADGLLLRNTYSLPHRSGISGAVTWGDYFFLESLLLVSDPQCLIDPLFSHAEHSGPR